MSNSVTDKNILKGWFKRGLKPLEVHFAAWMDSYWHKSEKIPTLMIEGLEDTLNSKAESNAIEDLDRKLNTHKADDERHKTAGEQGKLERLADDANGTYARKEELSEVVPVVLRATGVLGSTGMVKYTLDEDSKKIVENALLNGESLIGAVLCGSYTDSSSYVREVSFVCTYSVIIDGRILEVRFSRVALDSAYFMYFKTQMINGHITGTIMGGSESVIEYGKYLPERYYIDEPGSYDVNRFNSSGGILVHTSDTVIVDNLPAGFTSVIGYCLSSMIGCTQVITDTNLDQTAMRTYGYVEQADGTGAMTWSPWKRIDYKPEEGVVVLTGTYTTDEAGGNKFVMDDSSKERIKAYVKNNEVKPIIAHFRGGDSGLPFLEWSCEHVKILNGANRRFLFSTLSPETSGLGYHRFYFDVVTYSNGMMGVNIPFDYKDTIYSSEYLHNRYELDVSWDMNTFTESGGISVGIFEGCIGVNMPDGFTDMFGYVLANTQTKKCKCCTQVVTDRLLLKTMMRHSLPADEGWSSTVWLPWKEVGAKQEVYVVAEYPTDLTGYADGSIFIKQ